MLNHNASTRAENSGRRGTSSRLEAIGSQACNPNGRLSKNAVIGINDNHDNNDNDKNDNDNDNNDNDNNDNDNDNIGVTDLVPSIIFAGVLLRLSVSSACASYSCDRSSVVIQCLLLSSLFLAVCCCLCFHC